MAAPPPLNAHLDNELQRPAAQASGLAAPTALRASHPQLRFGLGRRGAIVLARITAQDVTARLPLLQSQGFVVSTSYLCVWSTTWSAWCGSSKCSRVALPWSARWPFPSCPAFTIQCTRLPAAQPPHAM
ncbi:MAG: hypothetical protein ACRYG7_51265 [Janthinobacterium lividum]